MKSILYVDKPKKQIFIDSLIGGIGWGIGTIIGAFLLFAVLGFLAAQIHAIPVIGEFVYNVIAEVEKLRGK
jgi:hypothetical protein